MGKMYIKICDWNNLRVAHCKVARGKRGEFDIISHGPTQTNTD